MTHPAASGTPHPMQFDPARPGYAVEESPHGTAASIDAARKRFADAVNAPHFNLLEAMHAADELRATPAPRSLAPHLSNIARSEPGNTRPWYRRGAWATTNVSGAPAAVELFLQIARVVPCAEDEDLEAEMDFLIDAAVANGLGVKLSA
jgi:hypothetical protein